MTMYIDSYQKQILNLNIRQSVDHPTNKPYTQTINRQIIDPNLKQVLDSYNSRFELQLNHRQVPQIIIGYYHKRPDNRLPLQTIDSNHKHTIDSYRKQTTILKMIIAFLDQFDDFATREVQYEPEAR